MKQLLLMLGMINACLGFAQQDRCYDRWMLDGRVAMANKQYEAAIEKFKIALDCEEISAIERTNIAAKLKQANDLFLAEIDRQRVEALKAREVAEQRQKNTDRALRKAIRSQESLKSALEAAEKELNLVQQKAKTSEARRLLLLASNEIKKGQVKTALALFGYVRDSLKTLQNAHLNQVLGDIVYHATAQQLNVDHLQIKMVNFSPNGDQLMYVVRPDSFYRFTHPDTLKLFNITGRTHIYLPNDLGKILAADFSKEGNHLVVASKSGKVGIWDNYGHAIHQFEAHQEAILAIKCLPGEKMLTCSRDRSAKMWDMEGRQLRTFQHLAPVYDAAFANEAHKVLTRSADKTVKLWEAETGQLLKVLDRHHLYVYEGELSPDGQHLLTTSANGEIRLWDMAGELLNINKKQGMDVLDTQFSADGKYYFVATSERTLQVHHLDGQMYQRLAMPAPIVQFASFSEDQLVLVGLENGRAELWDYDKGERLMTLDKHQRPIKSVAISPDGRHLLTLDEGGRALISQTIREFTLRMGSNFPALTPAQRTEYGIP